MEHIRKNGIKLRHPPAFHPNKVKAENLPEKPRKGALKGLCMLESDIEALGWTQAKLKKLVRQGLLFEDRVQVRGKPMTRKAYYVLPMAHQEMAE